MIAVGNNKKDIGTSGLVDSSKNCYSLSLIEL